MTLSSEENGFFSSKIFIALISAVISMAVFGTAILIDSLMFRVLLGIGVVVFVVLLLCLSVDRYLWMAYMIVGSLTIPTLGGPGVSAFVNIEDNWFLDLVVKGPGLESTIPLTVCFLVLIGAHVLRQTLVPFWQWCRDRLVRPSGLVPPDPSQNVQNFAGGPVTINQQLSSLASDVEIERAAADRIRAETDAKMADHLMRQNESLMARVLGPVVIDSTQIYTNHGTRVLLEDNDREQPTERKTTTSVSSELIPSTEPRPSAQNAQAITERFNERLSRLPEEETSLTPASDAERRLQEATAHKFLSDIRMYIDELDIAQAIRVSQELEPWLASNFQHIAAPLALSLYKALFDLESKQVRRASSEADRRAHWTRAELLLRKIEDVSPARGES